MPPSADVHALMPRKSVRIADENGKVHTYFLAEEGTGAGTEMLLQATERLLTAINLVSNLTLKVDEIARQVDQAVARVNAAATSQARFAQSADKLADALLMEVQAVTDKSGKVIGARRVSKIQGG